MSIEMGTLITVLETALQQRWKKKPTQVGFIFFGGFYEVFLIFCPYIDMKHLNLLACYFSSNVEINMKTIDTHNLIDK